MIVEFEAVDRAGKRVADTLEALDERTAVETLRKRDLFVTSMAPKGQSGSKDGKHKKSAPKPAHSSSVSANAHALSNVRLSSKQITMFTRQMAMLLNSGSGVVPALQSTGRQFTKEPHIQMVRQMCHDLEEGNTLTDSLRRFPQTFDSTYCAIIAAGEASGTLTEMFTRLAKVVGNRRTMRNKVIGAMVYPALLTTLSFGITAVLMFFVMPRFSDMFATLGVDLPTSTQIMVDTAAYTEEHWVGTVIALVAGLGTLVFAALSQTGRHATMSLLTHTPVVKKLIEGLLLGESFRVMGMLIEAKVGLLDVIDLVKGVTRQQKFQDLYQSLVDEVTSGGAVSVALESSGIVPSYICHAVRTGEESGNLGGSMTYVADILDEDNTELLGTVTKLFEPTILILMGFVVGGVAISLFLPMFDVTSAVNR